MSGKLLFACFDSGDLPTISPIVPLLQRQGHQIALLCNYKRPSIEINSDVRVYMPSELDNNSAYPLESFREFLSSMLNFEGLERTVNPNRLVENLFELYKDAKLPKYQQAYDSLIDSCLSEFLPDIAIICPCNTEATHFIRACRKRNLPHIFVLPQYYEFKQLSPFIIYKDGTPYIVASQHGRDRLKIFGLTDSNIIVAGNPRFDAIFQLKQNCLSKIEGAPQQILYTMQGLEDNLYLLDDLSHYVEDRNNIVLHVRPHPAATDKDIATINKYSSSKVLMDTSSSSGQALLSAAVLVTLSSLSVIEALILNVPTVVAKTNFLPDETPFVLNNDALLARDYAELSNALDQLLFDNAMRNQWLESHRDSYKKYTGIFFDNATTGLADTIERMLVKLK